MVGVGAGAHGSLSVSHIARDTVYLRRAVRNKKWTLGAVATATPA